MLLSILVGKCRHYCYHTCKARSITRGWSPKAEAWRSAGHRDTMGSVPNSRHAVSLIEERKKPKFLTNQHTNERYDVCFRGWANLFDDKILPWFFTRWDAKQFMDLAEPRNLNMFTIAQSLSYLHLSISALWQSYHKGVLEMSALIKHFYLSWKIVVPARKCRRSCMQRPWTAGYILPSFSIYRVYLN